MLVLFVSLLLASGFVYFLVRDYQRDLMGHQVAVLNLSTAQGYSHALDEALLRARTFLVDDYDGLVKTERQLHAYCEDEAKNPLAKYAAPEFRKFCEAVVTKLDAVERFKSANSIVGNSFHYLPELVGEIKSSGQRLRALDIYASLVKYAGYSEEAGEERRVRQFTTANSAWSKGLPSDFVNHVKMAAVAVRVRSETEKIAFTPDVENALMELQASYFLAYDQQTREASQSRNFLIIICAVLVVAIVMAFLKLRTTSRSLQELNRTLEFRVVARTEELSKALVQVKESQAILSQTTKMSALGEMAGGIAHEINTPLGTILLCGEMIGKFAEKNGDAGLIKSSKAIITTVHRISKIVQGLRRFCRDNSQDERSLVSLREVLDQTLIFCHEKFRMNGIEIRLTGDLDLVVSCVPEHLGQIILNLLNNSYDAIATTEKPHWVELRGVHIGQEIQLHVSDCGNGIPDLVIEKMMQPFFTTKEIGKGTGLGLSISKGIAEAHGGSLAYVNGAKHTTFLLSLPNACNGIQAA
jgi:signal transduction histidine kinase